VTTKELAALTGLQITPKMEWVVWGKSLYKKDDYGDWFQYPSREDEDDQDVRGT
jgi:hypothetical protein